MGTIGKEYQKKYFIGIDPGINGSMAKIDENGKIELHTAVPTHTYGKKKQFDLYAMGNFLKESKIKYYPNEIFIEKAQAMPGQGVVSMFSYGKGYGLWLGLIMCIGFQYTEVHPKVWTKLLKCGKAYGGKEGNYKRACQLFPEYRALIKKDQTYCDSLLIAEYGRVYR